MNNGVVPSPGLQASVTRSMGPLPGWEVGCFGASLKLTCHSRPLTAHLHKRVSEARAKGMGLTHIPLL